MSKTTFSNGGANDAAFLNNYYLHPGVIGNVYYVDSATGSSSNSGVAPGNAMATIDQAVDKCTAGNGDVIYVLPGHAETINATALCALDKAGITVIGMGNGSNKPTLTMATSTAATITVSAANVTLRNIRFVNNIDSLAVWVTVAEDYFTMEDCEFVTSSTKECVCFVAITTTKDFTTIRRCTFLQPTDPAATNGAAATGGVYIVDSEHVTIEGCKFSGNFETAIIHNKTTAATNLWIKDCFGIQNLSDAVPFVLPSGTTGGCLGGGFITPAEVAVTEATLSGTIPAGFFMFGTRFGNDGGGGQSAVLLSDAS